MSYFSGRNGKLSIKNATATGTGTYNEIGRMRDWTVNATTETIDTTCLADVDRTILPGLRSYSGSGTLLYYNTGENTSTDIKDITEDTFKPGEGGFTDAEFGNTADAPETVKLQLKLDNKAGSGNSRTIEMFAVITSFTMTCSVGEVVSADIAWTGHGAPTEWDL